MCYIHITFVVNVLHCLPTDCHCIGVFTSQRQGHWLSCSPLYFHHEEQGLAVFSGYFFNRQIIIKEAILSDFYYVSTSLDMYQTLNAQFKLFFSCDTVYKKFTGICLSK